MHFGHVFRARSQFRIILNEFCQSAHGKRLEGVMTIRKAYEFYNRLQVWYESLSGILSPEAIVLHSHLQLQ